jgi:hypothetical protein
MVLGFSTTLVRSSPRFSEPHELRMRCVWLGALDGGEQLPKICASKGLTRQFSSLRTDLRSFLRASHFA